MKKIIFVTLIVAVLGVWALYSVGTTKTTDLADTEALLVGSWQSADDAQSFIIFNSDGTAQDAYAGEVLAESTWELYAKYSDGEDAPSVFLKKVTNDMEDGGEFLYSVWNVTETELVLNYLTRGNTLVYNRVESVPAAMAGVEFQAYENNTYGFTLSHPVDWEVSDSSNPQEPYAIHEIVITESDYNEWRASSKVSIFENKANSDLQTWWNSWLTTEDQKKLKCHEENGDDAPCLFLRDLIEAEEDTQLGGADAIAVTLFRFDSEEVCTYAARGDYVYGLCAAGNNPNDPQAAQHLSITNKIKESFKFVTSE